MAVLAAAIGLTACASTPDDVVNRPSGEGVVTPAVVDYSPTVSDIGALLYMLSHPGVDVVAVTLPATGEAGCDLGTRVTLGILALYERDDIPVACDHAISPDARQWPAEFLSGTQNLAFSLPTPASSVDPRPAPDLIAQVAADADKPVVLLAVAPLTNVAYALTSHPEMKGELERIVIMGGSVDAPGNVEGTAAEWNFWIDPASAAIVLDSEVPITLVGLDATNDVPVPGFNRQAIQGAEQTDAIRYLGALVRLFPAVTGTFYYFWDELAAAVAAGEDVVTTEEIRLSVVTHGPEAGRSIRDPEGSSVTVAMGVPSPHDFYTEFLSRVAGAPVSVGGTATAEESAYLVALDETLVEYRRLLAEAFESGAFAENTLFDGPAAAIVLEPLILAITATVLQVERLTPPPSLATLHTDYLDALRLFDQHRDDIIDHLRSAESWLEFQTTDPFIGHFPSACEELRQEADWLGVDVTLCG